MLLRERYPMQRRFSPEESVVILRNACNLPEAAVRQFMVDRRMRDATIRDLTTTVRCVMGGSTAAANVPTTATATETETATVRDSLGSLGPSPSTAGRLNSSSTESTLSSPQFKEPKKICRQFAATGSCRFGSRCLYHHVLSPATISPHQHDNANTAHRPPVARSYRPSGRRRSDRTSPPLPPALPPPPMYGVPYWYPQYNCWIPPHGYHMM